jgi:gamma-glutamyl phosphate reductase
MIDTAEILSKARMLFSDSLSEQDIKDFLSGVVGKILEDKTLVNQAKNNDLEHFKLGNWQTVEKAVADRYLIQEKISLQFLEDEKQMALLTDAVQRHIYSLGAQS